MLETQREKSERCAPTMQWSDRKKKRNRNIENTSQQQQQKSVGEDDKDREKELIRSNNTK